MWVVLSLFHDTSNLREGRGKATPDQHESKMCMALLRRSSCSTRTSTCTTGRHMCGTEGAWSREASESWPRLRGPQNPKGVWQCDSLPPVQQPGVKMLGVSIGQLAFVSDFLKRPIHTAFESSISSSRGSRKIYSKIKGKRKNNLEKLQTGRQKRNKQKTVGGRRWLGSRRLGGAEGCGQEGGRPIISALCFPSPAQIRSFFLSGVFSWKCGRWFMDTDHSKCAFGIFWGHLVQAPAALFVFSFVHMCFVIFLFFSHIFDCGTSWSVLEG